jgi:hypothetical protein
MNTSDLMPQLSRKRSSRDQLPTFTTGALIRLAVIGVIVLCLVVSFVYATRAHSSSGVTHRLPKFADQPIAWRDGGAR